MKRHETLQSMLRMRCSSKDQGWYSGVSSRPFIYWPNAPQKQLPYNLGSVCFPVIPGGDGQEATLQDHSSRTSTGVIYKGPSDAGLQLWENGRKGKWSLPGDEEAQSWRTILQRFQAVLVWEAICSYSSQNWQPSRSSPLL